MKTTAYIRVGKDSNRNGRRPYKVEASNKKDHKPIKDTRGRLLPTIFFAVELDIPDNAFNGAARVIAKLNVPEEKLEIAAEVLEIE